MAASSLLKIRRRSEASLVLDRYNISQRQLAEVFEVSTSTISRALRGVQPLPDGFEATLRAVIGVSAAREVVAAIEAS